jgi:hypothetical protein
MTLCIGHFPSFRLKSVQHVNGRLTTTIIPEKGGSLKYLRFYIHIMHKGIALNTILMLILAIRGNLKINTRDQKNV